MAFFKSFARLLLHSFFKGIKGKEFDSTKTIIKNVVRSPRKPHLNTSSRKRKRIIISVIKAEMPKVKAGFYAVRVGHKPGIYKTWEECEKQVKKYPNAKYQKFTTLQEAEAFVFQLETSTQERSLSSSNLSKQKTRLSIPSSPRYPQTSNVDNGKLLKVWTDGSSRNNGRLGAMAGVGVYWGENNPRNVSERLPGPRQTNNRAEIMAVIRALETCPDNNVPLEINTDSKYTINAYTSWIPEWEKGNKWKTTKGKDVENKGLFKRLMKLIRARNTEVTIKYVPGHVGIEENEAADRLANWGAMMDAVDDHYDYGEDNKEILKAAAEDEESYLEIISTPSPRNSDKIRLNKFEYIKNVSDLDYPLTKDDFFSPEDKTEMENETGMRFV